MNLQETTEALEQNNIQVALDIGVHQQCSIDSNCPLAIELRRIIGESGITLQELLDGYIASQGVPPEPVPIQLPQFDGKVTISIAGHPVELDFNELIDDELRHKLGRKQREVEILGRDLDLVGRSLYTTYLNQIYELRRAKTLPQLEFSVRDITNAGCLITSDNTNYLFMFPREYHPQYIVTRGIRYQMADRDIKAIKRDAYILYYIDRYKKIIGAELLADDGNKLEHYHGRSWDCWGLVQIPDRWDGRLFSLTVLTNQLMGALATINKDSLIAAVPPGMPDIQQVFERSTKLGEEGVLEKRIQPEGAWITGATDAPTPARRWGGR